MTETSTPLSGMPRRRPALEATPAEHLLPANATSFERALAAPTRRLDLVPAPLRALWRPDDCPASHLPWLAWGFSVDTWNPAWPEATKRRVIREAMPLHRVKGTIGALRRALAPLGFAILVEEWFQYGGAPYHFRVVVEQGDATISEADLALIWRVILTTKNVRSMPEPLSVRARPSSARIMRAIAIAGQTVAIGPRRTPQVSMIAPLVAFTHTLDTTAVYPATLH